MKHQDTGLPAINKMLYIHVMNWVTVVEKNAITDRKHLKDKHWPIVWSSENFQWWKVTKYIYSHTIGQFKCDCEELLFCSSICYMLLHSSAPIYCSFNFTRLIWLHKFLAALSQTKQEKNMLCDYLLFKHVLMFICFFHWMYLFPHCYCYFYSSRRSECLFHDY